MATNQNPRPKASSTSLVIPYTLPGSEPVYAPTGSLVWNETTGALRVKLAAGTWSDVGSGSGGGTWFNGTSAPGGGTGSNGDFFLQTATGDVYLKTAGTWSVVGNILPTTLQRPLWYPPATPNAFDFEGNANPGWLYWDASNAAARAITTGSPGIFTDIGPSTAVPVASFGTQRRSWVRLQIPNTGANIRGVYYAPTLQTPTLPTWYWCRIGGPAVVGGGQLQIILGLFTNSAGHPDDANISGAGLYNAAGTSIQTPAVLSRVASADTIISFGGSNQAHTPIEYFAIYKTATSITGFAISESGNAMRLGSFLDSRTSFWVGFWVRGSFASPLGTEPAPILHVDFVRQSQTNEPWIQP